MKTLAAIAIAFISGRASAQNLVTNGNFEAGNSGFSSEYSYTFVNTTDGQYNVVKDPKSWNANWPSSGDHTSGTGNMMVVNGKTQSTPVVWRQQMSVLPNHTYCLSVWAANVSGSQPSRLAFRINGVTLQLSVTLTTQVGLWKNCATTWDSGASTSAMLEIVFISTESMGNDTALDDIVFLDAGQATVPVAIAQAVCLEWNSVLGTAYQIQSSLDLEFWTNIGNPVAGTGMPMTYCEKTTQPKKFFRVVGPAQ